MPTYREADVRGNAERCAEIVRRCHHGMGRHISGQGAIFWVFQILRDYAHTLQAGDHRIMPELRRLMTITDDLEDAQVPLPIVFGHHDLLPTNLGLDDGERLWLIDWEYGAFGTAMFDLANIASNNSFDMAGENLLLETYFGRRPAEAIRAFYAMKTASALREALWGMVSELHLTAPPAVSTMWLMRRSISGRFERVYSDYTRNFG